jgi:D-lactate dehydrogenase (cytochrome)
MQAEHGGAYGLMGRIKHSIDPQNLMNPGKLVNLT